LEEKNDNNTLLLYAAISDHLDIIIWKDFAEISKHS